MTSPQPNGTQEIHAHNRLETSRKSWSGVLAALAVVATGYAGYNYDAPEGSIIADVQDAVGEMIGRFSDPSAVNNPNCVAINPPIIEGLEIDPADMPRLCGRIITSQEGQVVHSDGAVHLEMFTDNPFSEEFWQDLNNQNSVIVRERLPQLLQYNEPEYLLEILDHAELCAEAVGTVVRGIASTRASSDPMGAGRERAVDTKLYTKVDGQQTLYKGGCS